MLAVKSLADMFWDVPVSSTTATARSSTEITLFLFSRLYQKQAGQGPVRYTPPTLAGSGRTPCKFAGLKNVHSSFLFSFFQDLQVIPDGGQTPSLNSAGKSD